MKVLFVFEMIGTVAFAVSGAQTAISKKMDLFGVIVLGMTTAIGGGIIRDLILGVTPPGAFREPVYALTAIGVSLLVFIPAIRGSLSRSETLLQIMDAIGLGVFTVVGVSAASQQGNLFLSLFLGVMTGCGGGVLRDLFAGNRPMIFVRHFYATASLIGAAAACLLWPLGKSIAGVTAALVVVVLRLLAARYKWHLPRA